MNEGEVISRQERIDRAMQELQELGANRGDSFDMGGFEEGGSTDLVTKFLSNPQQLIGSFNLTPSQAKNIKSLVVGSGTGAIHRMLSQHLGDEIASAIGGLISGYLARRIIGK